MNGSTLLKRNNVLSILLRLVKIGYLKVIWSKSFLFRSYGVPINAAPKLHPSRLANQKRRQMFLQLWGIQTRYCAPVRRRSIYHSSWVLQPSQRKLKTILTQNFGGQKGAVWEMCEWRVLFRPRFSFHVAVTRLTFRTTKEKTHKKTSAFSYFTNRWTRTQARLNGFSANDATSKKMFYEQNNKKFARASFVFLYISLPLLHDYNVKMPNSRFMKNINKHRWNFISLSELGYGPLEFNFRRVRLHLTK